MRLRSPMVATPEGRRLALAAALARHCSARVPVATDELVAAARSFVDADGSLADRQRVRFDPAFPGATAGPNGKRLVLACVLSELDGSPIGTAFTTLIVGRTPTVSVAPPGTAAGADWLPLSH